MRREGVQRFNICALCMDNLVKDSVQANTRLCVETIGIETIVWSIILLDCSVRLSSGRVVAQRLREPRIVHRA